MAVECFSSKNYQLLCYGKITLWKPIKEAWLVNLNEEREEELPVNKDGSLNMKVGHKKIVTLELIKL